MRIRPTEALLPEFFVPLWNSPVIHDQVLDKAKTTNGTYKINGQDVRSILVPVPSKEEQRLIGDAILVVEANSRGHADQLAGLHELKSALMSGLLTGEVRVKPDEEGA
jgi:type I restriction enzyme S subunit